MRFSSIIAVAQKRENRLDTFSLHIILLSVFPYIRLESLERHISPPESYGGSGVENLRYAIEVWR